MPTDASAPRPAERSTVSIHLERLRPFLHDAPYNEVVINRPGEVLTETKGEWETFKVPEIDFRWCYELAKLVANYSNQSISDSHPMVGATLPGGERIQIVLAPVVKHPSITIRRPSNEVMTFDEIYALGGFNDTRCEQSLRLDSNERKIIEEGLPELDRHLLDLFRRKQWKEFLPALVKGKKNIVLSGQTGSGKTTLGNALCMMIPKHERVITVEDTPEMRLAHHNQVNMFYSRDNQGLAKIVPKQIFESILRERPDRVLPAELRGDEVYYFLENVVNSGHPGTISTVHANTSKLAYRRMANMIQSSPEGRGLEQSVVLEMLHALIDVVIQTDKQVIDDDGRNRKVVSEIYYDPAYARKQMG